MVSSVLRCRQVRRAAAEVLGELISGQHGFSPQFLGLARGSGTTWLLHIPNMALVCRETPPCAKAEFPLLLDEDSQYRVRQLPDGLNAVECTGDGRLCCAVGPIRSTEGLLTWATSQFSVEVRDSWQKSQNMLSSRSMSTTYATERRSLDCARLNAALWKQALLFRK